MGRGAAFVMGVALGLSTALSLAAGATKFAMVSEEVGATAWAATGAFATAAVATSAAAARAGKRFMSAPKG